MSRHRHSRSFRTALAALPLLAVGTVATAAPAAAETLQFGTVWTTQVPDLGPISLSSPDLATLHGAPAVVIGDTGGDVNALSLATGKMLPGWPASTGGIPVLSTPSVAAINPGSNDDTVFIGAGTPGHPHEGGYEAFNPNGTKRWAVNVRNVGKSFVSGIVASPSVGELQGQLAVVAPSIGDEEDAINVSTGKVLPGFPWFTGDGDYATPALIDLKGNGQTDIVNGGGQVAGLAFGYTFTDGGHVDIVRQTGNEGTQNPHGGLICAYNPPQSVESSPDAGQFLPGDNWGIAVGTGNDFPGNPDSDVVLVVGPHCELIWVRKLDGLTSSSPALADILGNGKLSVIEGTDNQHGGGSVWAMNAATGAVQWHVPALGEVMGGISTANFGAGYQDVVVASTGGAEVLDGRTGALLATVETGVGLQNTALITDDPNGEIGVTLGGYNAYDHGVVEHFELPGSQGGLVDQPGAWPMFHHDPMLSGNAQLPFPAN